MNNVNNTNEAKLKLRDLFATDSLILSWLKSGQIPGISTLFFLWFGVLGLLGISLYYLYDTVHNIIKSKNQDQSLIDMAVMLFFFILLVVGICGGGAVAITKAYIKVTKLIRKEKDLNVVAEMVSSSLPLREVQSSTIVQNNITENLPVTIHGDYTNYRRCG